MDAAVRRAQAQALFGLCGARCTPLRRNENDISLLEAQDRYALRIHAPAPGFEPLPLCKATPAAQREAETALLLELREAGFCVQRPVPATNGELVPKLADGTPVTLLSWLAGESFDILFPDGDVPDAAAYAVGALAGRLNVVMARLAPRFSCVRPRYGENVVPLLAQRFEKARSLGVLEEKHLSALRGALAALGPRMREAEGETGLGLCHTDLSPGNFILNGAAVSPIDFSLAGIASPYLDLASLLANFTRPRVRGQLLAGFEAGYGKRAQLRLAEPYYALLIMLFIALRYREAKDWDWFPVSLSRWSEGCFLPLASGEAFLGPF